jgi:hypothetical protein
MTILRAVVYQELEQSVVPPRRGEKYSIRSPREGRYSRNFHEQIVSKI